MNFILFRMLIGRTYKNYRTIDLLSKEIFDEYNKIISKKKSKSKFFISVISGDINNISITKKCVDTKEYILHALYSENELYNQDMAYVFFLFDNLHVDSKKEIIKDFIFANFELFDRINEFLYITNIHNDYSKVLQAEPLYQLMQHILPFVDKTLIVDNYERSKKGKYNPNNKIVFLNSMIKQTNYLVHDCNHFIRYAASIENDQEFANDMIAFIFGHVYTNQKNKYIIEKSAASVILSKEREEPYMFTIGNDTIEKMNSIKVEIKTDNLDQMSKIIGILKSSIDRYKKFSNPGFFRKLFSNKLEIQANVTISIINFENSLDNGDEIRKKLQNQYDSFQNSVDQLKNIFNEFTKNLEELNEYIENKEISIHERDRLLRRKTDLAAAQLLCANSAAQFELSMSNTITLIDKFTTIEQILKPVITQNMQLTKEMQRILK